MMIEADLFINIHSFIWLHGVLVLALRIFVVAWKIF